MKKPPLSIETVGLYSSKVRLGDAVLISGDFGLAWALDFCINLNNRLKRAVEPWGGALNGPWGPA